MPSQDLATLFKSMAAQGFECHFAIHGAWKDGRAGKVFIEFEGLYPKGSRSTLQLTTVPDNIEDIVNALASQELIKHYAG